MSFSFLQHYFAQSIMCARQNHSESEEGESKTVYVEEQVAGLARNKAKGKGRQSQSPTKDAWDAGEVLQKTSFWESDCSMRSNGESQDVFASQ
jgi:hypothetical protein